MTMSLLKTYHQMNVLTRCKFNHIFLKVVIQILEFQWFLLVGLDVYC